MGSHEEKHAVMESLVKSLKLDASVTRRRFLQLSGVSVVGISAVSPLLARSSVKPLIIMDQAEGLVFLLHRALTIRDTEQEEYEDIRRTTTSIGTTYLFSSTHLEPGHASILAEWLDVGQYQSP